MTSINGLANSSRVTPQVAPFLFTVVLPTMDKYKDSDIGELAGVLKTLARKNSGPGLSPELRDLVCTLKSQKLRHSNDAHEFCVSMDSSMRVLLELLKDCEGSADNRDIVLVLGTVGNLCALGSEPRNIVSVIETEKKISVLNYCLVPAPPPHIFCGSLHFVLCVLSVFSLIIC